MSMSALCEHICACMHEHIHVDESRVVLSICVCSCVHTCVSTCVYMYVHVCEHVCVLTCMHMCSYVYMCLRAQIARGRSLSTLFSS